MGLPTNNKNNSKLPGKGGKASATASKFIAKPGNTKAVGATKKPIKTGGSRGS
jgi:hypothetical protein